MSSSPKPLGRSGTRPGFAERNRKRARHAHFAPAQKFSTFPPVNRPEPVHAADLSFPSNLRLGMVQDEELVAAHADREARLQQAAARLAGPLRRVATLEENQLRVDLISFDLELQRRTVASCLRHHA